MYVMFDASVASNAPRVRVQMLSSALARQVELRVVSGSRFARLGAALKAAFGRDLRSADGVYVETITTSAMPWDLIFLVAARLQGKPVGIYFRDAYQLFRDLYPLRGWRSRLSDAAWRLSNALLRRLATVRFAPTRGLASVLHLRDAVLLPPGTDPSAPDLGVGDGPVVGYVGALNPADGFDRLLHAVELVRASVPDVRLLAVGPAPSPGPQLPSYVSVRSATRDQLPALLAPVRVCVIPRPINPYSDLASPVKLTDYLAFGKPILTTATRETRLAVEPHGAALVVADSPRAIADGLLRILTDDELARDLARRARALAESPEMSWDARATTLLSAVMRERAA